MDYKNVFNEEIRLPEPITSNICIWRGWEKNCEESELFIKTENWKKTQNRSNQAQITIPCIFSVIILFQFYKIFSSVSFP